MGEGEYKDIRRGDRGRKPAPPSPLSLENNLNNYRPCFFIGDAKQLLAYVSPLFLSGRETMQGPLNFLKRSFFEDLFPSILLYRCRRGLERQCDSPPLFYRLTRDFLCVPQYSLSFVSFRVRSSKVSKVFLGKYIRGNDKIKRRRGRLIRGRSIYDYDLGGGKAIIYRRSQSCSIRQLGRNWRIEGGLISERIRPRGGCPVEHVRVLLTTGQQPPFWQNTQRGAEQRRVIIRRPN